MATTIDSVDLYLSKISGTTTWDIHVDIHSAGNYTSNPTTGTVLGSSIVSIDDVSTSPGWISFIFTPAITITTENFYAIHIWCDTINNQAVRLRMHASGDWSDATTGLPYAGKERAWTRAYLGSWTAGNTRAYRINCTGCDDNVAESPVDGTTYAMGAGSISYGQGIRTYLAPPALPSKPTTPTPANDATEVDFTGFQLSWVDGGGATSYDVYIGTSGSLTLVSDGQAGTTYTTTLAELQTIFAATPINQVIYWRVDAVNAVGTTTGDEWNFDARPAKVTTPYPAALATGIRLYPTYTWAASTVATSYNLSISIP